MSDAPRFVPPPQGATPPPQGTVPGPLSGYDIGNHAPDAYLFLAASGYTQMRAEFLKLTGPIPTLPAWAFGLWFCW